MGVHLTHTVRMPSSRLQQRIDSTLRKEAEAILATQGIKPSQAILLFYTEVKRSRGLPFKPSPVSPEEIPNAKLRRDLREARSGKGVRAFHGKKEFLDSLH